MKKILLASFTLFILNAKAQQDVPNGGFENWSSPFGNEKPDSWNTIDSFATIQGGSSVTKSTDAAIGDFSIKLTPFQYLGVLTIPGIATTGTLNTTSYQIVGGQPDTLRHAQLFGQYKFTSVSNDSMYILVQLTKWDNVNNSRINVAGGIFGTTQSISTYTPFAVNLQYASALYPDTALIQIFSSVLGSSHLGTTLYVDGLYWNEFTGLEETVFPKAIVFPNPASDKIIFDMKKNLQEEISIDITDVNGRNVYSSKISESEFEISVAEFLSGQYFYSIRNRQGILLKADQFVVKH